MVATTKEGYLIPTYGPTGISPSAGAEAGMAAGRAVQTQREQTLNSRQARDSVDQQMKIRTEEQRRIEEDRVIAAAERARLEAARKKYAAGLSLPGMEAAAVPTDSGVVAAPGAQRAGLSFGPNTPAMEPVTMGVQPISFGPPAPAGARATVAAGVATTLGTVAGEILGSPRGAPAPPINPKVIDAGPARMTQEMEMLRQQDAQLEQLMEYYVAIRNIPEASALQFQRLQLRSAYQALQGAQAVARMEMGDFSMAAGALSTATGTTVQIQPRVGGTFNLLANGQVYADGLTAAERKAYVRSTTDSAYRTQQAAVNEAMFTADIERRGKDADAINTMMLEVAKLVQTGENAAALEKLKQSGLSVQSTDSGIFLFSQDGIKVFMIDLEGRITDANGDSVPGPASTRIDIQ